MPGSEAWSRWPPCGIGVVRFRGFGFRRFRRSHLDGLGLRVFLGVLGVFEGSGFGFLLGGVQGWRGLGVADLQLGHNWRGHEQLSEVHEKLPWRRWTSPCRLCNIGALTIRIGLYCKYNK